MYKYMSFRKNLEHLRKSAKLSQEDFAYKLGVSRQAVSKWESGAAYPETEKILKMCDIFNCSLDELMKDDIAQIRSEQSKRYSFSDMLEVFNKLLRGTFENFSSRRPRHERSQGCICRVFERYEPRRPTDLFRQSDRGIHRPQQNDEGFIGVAG